jgi:hypothetical protein
MPISRRQFFRGLVGQNEDRQREQQRRIEAVEAYVRTNLLPYDFALTPEQTAEVLAAVVGGTDTDGDHNLFTGETCLRMSEIAEGRIDVWRKEYLAAEEVRRNALVFVSEFLVIDATTEDLRSLHSRFQTSHLSALENEIERQVRIWLSGLPNAQLAACENPALRDMVFSEIRSWC